jgi:copper homeostasis protein
MKPLIEICVDRLDSVQICTAHGVDRIELCAALSEGGITPSIGFLQAARRIFPGKIMMMIRPRSGDFFYSDEEIDMMQADIHTAREHGADGVVFGCLLTSGEVDQERTQRLLQAAEELDVTFHRAFDVTPDLSRSLDTLISLGIPRVLTSGGEADVWKGIGKLKRLVAQAAGRITILPGGGVMAGRVDELLSTIGAAEAHLSARHTIDSAMVFVRHDIPMGASVVASEYVHKVADPALLAQLTRSPISHS